MTLLACTEIALPALAIICYVNSGQINAGNDFVASLQLAACSCDIQAASAARKLGPESLAEKRARVKSGKQTVNGHTDMPVQNQQLMQLTAYLHMQHPAVIR